MSDFFAAVVFTSLFIILLIFGVIGFAGLITEVSYGHLNPFMQNCHNERITIIHENYVGNNAPSIIVERAGGKWEEVHISSIAFYPKVNNQKTGAIAQICDGNVVNNVTVDGISVHT